MSPFPKKRKEFWGSEEERGWKVHPAPKCVKLTRMWHKFKQFFFVSSRGNCTFKPTIWGSDNTYCVSQIIVFFCVAPTVHPKGNRKSTRPADMAVTTWHHTLFYLIIISFFLLFFFGEKRNMGMRNTFFSLSASRNEWGEIWPNGYRLLPSSFFPIITFLFFFRGNAQHVMEIGSRACWLKGEGEGEGKRGRGGANELWITRLVRAFLLLRANFSPWQTWSPLHQPNNFLVGFYFWDFISGGFIFPVCSVGGCASCSVDCLPLDWVEPKISCWWATNNM